MKTSEKLAQHDKNLLALMEFRNSDIPSIAVYEAFRDRPLVLAQTDYLPIPRKSHLREDMMDRWGITSLGQLFLFYENRIVDQTSSQITKICNEAVYDMGGGIFLLHSWRGADSKCNWQNGDMELFKLSPEIERIYRAEMANVSVT